MTGTLLTDELRARIGEIKVYVAPEPIGKAAFRYFAQAIGDDNPLYTDDQFAQQHGYAGVIAPPTLICETNQYANLVRESTGYAGHGWDIEIPGTRLLRGGNEYTFHQAVRPDDILTVTWRIVDMVERASSKGMPMVIVTSEATYENHLGELLVTNIETLIYQSRGGAS
jgi:acyl dehydratase